MMSSSSSEVDKNSVMSITQSVVLVCVTNVLITCCLQARTVQSFNLEPRLPVYKTAEKGTYFGYSVSQHPIYRNNARADYVVLVGAPRGDNGQPGTRRAGSVFACPLTRRHDDCYRVEAEGDVTRAPESDIDKDDQWLGVTVTSQGGRDGKALACAHRYVIKGATYRWGQGICYSMTNSLTHDRAWEPCANRPVDRAHEQFGFCAAGTSAHITNTNDSMIVVGSPGPYTWRGTVFTIKANRGLKDWGWHMGPVIDEDAPIEKYSYLGMSVSSGRFFKDSPGISFVAGAPRCNDTGCIVFYEKSATGTHKTRLVIPGHQFAASFGYTIIAIDINNDGWTDLVVGAPFYFAKAVGGAVYIYMNKEGSLSANTVPIKLFGKPESRFGFSMSGVGDLNKDGFQDLAIGAPYEGDGAIYIYFGTADGIHTEPAQVIRPEQLPSAVRSRLSRLNTFGYSLSGGADMDYNNYPDLSVGNYDSDSIITIRARPILDITTSVTGEIDKPIDPTRQGCAADPNSPLVCFSFKACFTMHPQSRRSPPPHLTIKYRIEAETFAGKKYYRVRFRASNNTETPNIVQRDISVSSSQWGAPHCASEIVYLKDKKDIQSAIKFKLTYDLAQAEPDLLAADDSFGLPNIDKYPILNQKEASKIFEARFVKNCGSNDFCESDVVVKAQANLPMQDGKPVLFLGEESVNLTIHVKNLAEPAYDASLYIQHPLALSFAGSRSDALPCSPYNLTLVRCELGNPFDSSENVDVAIRFTPRPEADAETSLLVVIFVNTTSSDASMADNEVVLDIGVVRAAEVRIRGNTKPEQIWYGGEIKGAAAMQYEDEIGGQVFHTYEVFNHGPYMVPKLHVTVNWPLEAAGDPNHAHGPYLLYVTDIPTVSVSGGTAEGSCRVEKPEHINPLHLKKHIQTGPSTLARVDDSRRTTTEPPTETTINPDLFRRPTSASKGGGGGGEEMIEEVEPSKPRVQTTTTYRKTSFSERRYNRKYSTDEDNEVRRKRDVVTPQEVRQDGKIVSVVNIVDQVSIFSDAFITLPSEYEIKQNNTDDDSAEAETRAYPDASLYQRSEAVSIWIYILAVIAGIIILALVTYCLHRRGFFDRKRAQQDGYSAVQMQEKSPTNGAHI